VKEQGESVMSENVQATSDQTFDNDILGDVPVLVDFWAEWCGPCRALGPIVDEIAKDNEGKLKVFKLNVDENQSTATKFKIMSIPTLVFLKNGQEVDKIVGALPKSAIQEKVDTLVS